MPESDSKTEDVESEREYEWLIKPCEFYKEEYNDCTSIRARFHQYFIFGEMIDCKQWKTDYNNCCKWTKYKTDQAYNDLIQSEKERRLKRLLNHYQNDVWQKRDKPPENWNAPLPEWLEERRKNSYLRCVTEKLKSEQSKEVKNRFCAIM